MGVGAAFLLVELLRMPKRRREPIGDMIDARVWMARQDAKVQKSTRECAVRRAAETAPEPASAAGYGEDEGTAAYQD
jgi:hypothetical protein